MTRKMAKVINTGHPNIPMVCLPHYEVWKVHIGNLKGIGLNGTQ